MHKIFFFLYIFGIVCFLSILITFIGSLIFLKIKKIKVKKQVYFTYLIIFIILIIIIIISDVLI